MGEYVTPLVVGVGGRAGVSVAEVCALVEETLRGAGLATGSVTALATVESKTAEAGLAGAAERFGVPLVGYSAERLAAIVVPHPSDAVRDAAGTSSVAEAAALAGAGNSWCPSAGRWPRPVRWPPHRLTTCATTGTPRCWTRVTRWWTWP